MRGDDILVSLWINQILLTGFNQHRIHKFMLLFALKWKIMQIKYCSLCKNRKKRSMKQKSFFTYDISVCSFNIHFHRRWNKQMMKKKWKKMVNLRYMHLIYKTWMKCSYKYVFTTQFLFSFAFFIFYVRSNTVKVIAILLLFYFVQLIVQFDHILWHNLDSEEKKNFFLFQKKRGSNDKSYYKKQNITLFNYINYYASVSRGRTDRGQ